MRFMRLLFVLFALCLSLPAHAGMTISFWSHDMDKNFPHTFITTHGTDAQGRSVDANYGFTATSLTPALLWGSVNGKMEDLSPGYIQRSQKRFTMAISQEDYDRVMAVVHKWKALKGKSYNLNTRNCIHFVGEVGIALGLKVSWEKALMKKPRSFLDKVMALNPFLKPEPK